MRKVYLRSLYLSTRRLYCFAINGLKWQLLELVSSNDDYWTIYLFLQTLMDKGEGVFRYHRCFINGDGVIFTQLVVDYALAVR